MPLLFWTSPVGLVHSINKDWVFLGYCLTLNPFQCSNTFLNLVVLPV